MKTKTKTFDCVEMKHKAQKALLDEFESRRAEFATLTDFLNDKLVKSDIASSVWKKFEKQK